MWSCLVDRGGIPAIVLARSPFRLPRRNAIASDARYRHSGVACSIPAGGHGMLTMVLAPVDRSLSPGSEEMSNPLRIANARSAEGSVPMVSSCSGLSPSSSLRSSSWSEVGRATGWCRSSLRPCLSSNPSLPSLPLLLDSLVSGTRACKADGFSS